MKKVLLKAAEERLLDMRRAVLKEMDSDLREGRESNKDEGMDTYDLASEERDREISFILSDRERGKLQGIQEALERVADGTYGVCEMCEGDIAQGRLEALPFSRLCVGCQQEREKEAKTMRKASDDDRSFRRLGVGDLDEENS